MPHRKTQNELSEKSVEATELREALEDRQRELRDRVTTVKRRINYTDTRLLVRTSLPMSQSFGRFGTT